MICLVFLLLLARFVNLWTALLGGQLNNNSTPLSAHISNRGGPGLMGDRRFFVLAGFFVYHASIVLGCIPSSGVWGLLEHSMEEILNV